MDPQLITLVVGIFGGGGLLGLALKRTWSGSDRADDAFLRGYEKSAEKSEGQLADLRAEIEKRLTEQAANYQREIAAITEHVNRLHRALARLVPLISPEHMPEATAIVMELNMPASTARPPKGTP